MVLGSSRSLAATALPLLVMVSMMSPRPLSAHEIPNDVTIQAYIKPEATRVVMLVRVPLIAMRDMTWPFRAPDVLDLARAPFELNNAATLWVGDEATMYADDRALPAPRVLDVRATPGGNTSFGSFDAALAWLRGPRVPDDTEVTIKEGFLDVMFEYPVESASAISFSPRWGRLGQRALTILHYVLPDGAIRTIQVEGDPGIVHLDPSVRQTLVRFGRQGLMFVRSAADPILLLLCLVIPFRRPQDIALIAGAFFAAQAVTLIGTSYFAITPDTLWFAPVITTLVAVSLVYVAVENIVNFNVRRRRTVAFLLGLVQGFAFGLALNPTRQFAGTHPLTAVLAFIAGTDVGLLVWVVVIALAALLLFRYVVPEHLGLIVISALVAHTAWHWMTERGSLALQYQISWPALTPAFFAAVLRWLMLAVATAGALWLLTLIGKPGALGSQRTGSR